MHSTHTQPCMAPLSLYCHPIRTVSGPMWWPMSSEEWPHKHFPHPAPIAALSNSPSLSDIFYHPQLERGSYIYCQLLNKNLWPLRCSSDNIEHAVIVPSQYLRCCHWYQPGSHSNTRDIHWLHKTIRNSIFYFPSLAAARRDWLWPRMIQWTMAGWRNVGSVDEMLVSLSRLSYHSLGGENMHS